MIKRRLAIGRIKTGCVEEYIQAHKNISSQMQEEYKKAGIEKISCYLRGLDLYIYSECDMDVWEAFDKTTMEQDAIFQEHMRKIAETVCGADELVEVYHLNNTEAVEPSLCFYVSPSGNDATGNGTSSNPWATIEKARDHIRLNYTTQTSDITVYLKNGTYTLLNTVVFNASDSGKNGYNILYRADPGSTPELSGGVDITSGWTLHDSQKNIYKKTGIDWNFRQLYINGIWGVRARSKKLTNPITGEGYFESTHIHYPFIIDASTIGDWANNGVTEFVWVTHWSQYRGRIENYTINGSTATVYFKTPESSFAVNHHSKMCGEYPVNYFYFENAYELLTEEGEWFLDRTNSTLYYKPRAGEIMNTTQIIAPKVEKLISLEGSLSTPVHNIQFHGITFKHDNWTAVSDFGYVPVQGGMYYQTEGDGGSNTFTENAGNSKYDPAPGMMNLLYANNIRMERNIFTLGGSWGIMESKGCDHNHYVGNHFNKLASGAITLGNTDSRIGMYELPTGQSAYDVVKNNLIDSIGHYYNDAVGIMALKVKNVTIEYNEIRNVPYSAISIGLEWNDSGNQDCHDNIIRYNRLHDVMKLLDDGGPIYTLGKQQGTNLCNNYHYNVTTSPYNNGNPVAGTYLDGGSSFITVQCNVLDDLHNLYKNKPSMVTFVNDWPGVFPIHDNVGRYNYYNCSDEGILSGYSMWSDNINNYETAWAPAAIEIMNGAGIEASYRDIGDVTLGANLAVAAVSTASSALNSNCLALKGNDNNCENNMWASDEIEENPWWQVDLGVTSRIYQVSITARQDCDHSDSRKNFAIYASNDSDFITYTELDVVGDTVVFPHKGIYSKIVNSTSLYRYVRIARINNKGHFNFAECKVLGISSRALLEINE